MFVLVSILLSLAPSVGSTATPEHVVVHGTQVLLEPPPGFTQAERYSGLESVDTGATVMVIELPFAYSEAVKGWTREKLGGIGVKVLDSDKAAIAGRVGMLIHASQDNDGTPYLKWMGVFGDDKRVVQVIANFPKATEDALSRQLRDCVVGAKWDRNITVDPFAFLSFQISVPEELKFFARIQNSLLYTRTGEANKDAPAEPMFSVTPSLGDVQVEDVKATAERRLQQLSDFTKVVIETSEPLLVGRLRAWEIVAKAYDDKGKTKLVLYMVMVVDDLGYHLIVGNVGAEKRDKYLPVFRKTTASFALKTNAK